MKMEEMISTVRIVLDSINQDKNTTVRKLKNKIVKVKKERSELLNDVDKQTSGVL